MGLIAVGITLSPAVSSALVPVTSSNVEADITAAVTDLGTLATAITAAASAASTADTNTGTVVTAAGTMVTDALAADGDAGTVVTDTTTADTDAGTVVTDLATTVTDFNLAFGTGTDGLTTLLGSAVAYNATTMQFSGTMGGNATITPTQGAALYALINTATTALLAAQTAMTTAKTATATAKTDAATAKAATAAAYAQSLTLNTDTTTAKASTATAKADTAALSTTAVGTDLTNAQAVLGGTNILLQTDDTVTTSVGQLSGALQSALAFIRASGILPP